MSEEETKPVETEAPAPLGVAVGEEVKHQDGLV